ncbi:unnamed protein product [Ceratitis capitata]|uniref:(Mediterranean fruit fly) hypothetical protein n=1 Tax=Ceratitis capitata TaxID=7213 RepID=A0A811UBR1_CERCA|nr:unnamed protein product [Ceratitis capitata]
MRITLSVLLATLTIYCSATVLSLPRSLIATAASLARHHARQQRGSGHSNDGTAEAAAASLLQMRMWPSAAAEVRSKKDAAGFVLDGRNIATNSYTDTGTDTDTTGDDIDRLSDSYELVTTNNHNNNHNNAGFKQAHPYQLVSGKLADVKDVVAHAISGNRKLPTEYDLNALLASAADTLAWQRAARAQQTTQQKPESQTWLQAPRIRAMQMKEFFTPLKYWAHHCQPPDRNCPREYYRALLADR